MPDLKPSLLSRAWVRARVAFIRVRWGCRYAYECARAGWLNCEYVGHVSRHPVAYRPFLRWVATLPLSLALCGWLTPFSEPMPEGGYTGVGGSTTVWIILEVLRSMWVGWLLGTEVRIQEHLRAQLRERKSDVKLLLFAYYGDEPGRPIGAILRESHLPALDGGLAHRVLTGVAAAARFAGWQARAAAEKSSLSARIPDGM